MVGAGFFPITTERLDLNVGGLCALHANGSLHGGGVIGGTLYVQDRPAFWQECGKLPSLKASDFGMVAGNAEGGDLGNPPQAVDVIDVAVENHPSNVGGYGCFRGANQSSRGQGFKQYGIGRRA